MGMQFPAGQKVPSKYGKVGPNYSKWGEQEHNGYVYDPATDKYYFDPKAKARWEAAAQKELKDEFDPTPKQPSIYEQAAASALPLLIGTAGKYAFSKPGRDWLGGLLGLGDSKSKAVSGFGSSVFDELGDFGDEAWGAVSDVGSSILDYGGDFIDAVGDYGGQAIDWLTGLF